MARDRVCGITLCVNLVILDNNYICKNISVFVQDTLQIILQEMSRVTPTTNTGKILLF